MNHPHSKMRLLSQLSCLACVLGVAVGQQPVSLPPGSCSERCDGANATRDILLPCSCSRSCSVYRDCCYDSGHRTEGTSSSSRMCLSLSGRGRFLSISGCPRGWTGPTHFCAESIGHLPPVTSDTSGITYANRFCASCNGDDEKLSTWSVELRCCSEHDESDGRRFVYKDGYLWSEADNHEKCPCHYVARDNDTSFADGMELRSCEASPEIAKCSSSWRDVGVEELCRSFLDPVYVGDQIYRNIYCGECNFERVEGAKCLPRVVESKLSEGWNMEGVFAYCTRHEVRSCLDYFNRLQRGISYPLSRMLKIREEGCVPPEGRRCCEGFRYDFGDQKCRRLARRNSRRRNNL